MFFFIFIFTVVEVAAQLVVGAALDHLGHVLRLLVHGHGSDDAAVGRRRGQLDLDGTRLGDLTVQLLQQRRVLQWVEGKGRERRGGEVDDDEEGEQAEVEVGEEEMRRKIKGGGGGGGDL